MTTTTKTELDTISPKVKLPAAIVGIVGPILVLLGVFGIEAPVSEDMIVEAVGAVIFIVAFVQAVLGYYFRDPLRNG